MLRLRHNPYIRLYIFNTDKCFPVVNALHVSVARRWNAHVPFTAIRNMWDLSKRALSFLCFRRAIRDTTRVAVDDEDAVTTSSVKTASFDCSKTVTAMRPVVLHERGVFYWYS